MNAIRVLQNHKILLVVLFIAGFIVVQKATAQTPDKFKTDFYKVNYGGCSQKVQMKVKLIGNNLYSDSHGNIFFLTYDNSDETGKYRLPVFIQRFPNDCADYIDIDTNVDFSSYDLKNFIDFATFRFISEGVYKDTLRFYYYTPMADGGNISIGQASTFIELEKGFYRGSDGRLYIKTQSLIHPPEEYGPDFYRQVPNIHIPTFELLCSQGWYAKDKDSVYIIHSMTDGKHIWVLEKADASTFECINYRWGKDKNYVFENGIILTGMNPHTMNILDTDSNGYFQMITDEDQLFYGHKEITGIDINSFTCTRKDSINIYQDKYWIYDPKYFLNQEEKYRTKK